jgi:hypothetical protein
VTVKLGELLVSPLIDATDEIEKRLDFHRVFPVCAKAGLSYQM